MTKKKVLLVRHAESQANAGMPTSFAHSIPLSLKGITQAKNFAKKFKIKPKLIVVSKYLRTQETAKPLISK